MVNTAGLAVHTSGPTREPTGIWGPGEVGYGRPSSNVQSMGHALGHSAEDVDANLRTGADIIASLRKGARPSASQLSRSLLGEDPTRELTPRCVAPP